jgi:hypothetical protein
MRREMKIIVRLLVETDACKDLNGKKYDSESMKGKIVVPPRPCPLDLYS